MIETLRVHLETLRLHGYGAEKFCLCPYSFPVLFHFEILEMTRQYHYSANFSTAVQKILHVESLNYKG